MGNLTVRMLVTTRDNQYLLSVYGDCSSKY